MRIDAALGRHGDFVPTAVLRLASDQRLVEQVHAGSERAFEALFDRYHRPVLAFCWRMLGSREAAEDVAQLTFLAAYRDLVRTKPPVVPRRWLYAIARHRCLSELRARRDRVVGSVPEPGGDPVAVEVATRADLRAILADVARLPPDQRVALVLAELDDVSHEEIARILGCRRVKVKALVFQARASLAAARAARETPCNEIREQLATLRGGALLRAPLRRHLRDCARCRAFREQLSAERRALGLLLPVAPTLGLKRAVLSAMFGSGGGAGGTAVTAGALSAGGLAATALVALTIPAGGITATVKASRDGGEAPRTIAPAARASPPSTLPGRAYVAAAPFQPHRKHPSPTVPSRDRTQPPEPPAQTETTGKSVDQPDRTNSPGQAEPAKPAGVAKPTEPPDNGQLAPATPSEPPRPHGQATSAIPAEPAAPAGAGTPAAPPTMQVTPGTPAAPPRTHRQVTPGTPAAPPRTHRQVTPGTPAAPPRTHRQVTPGTPAAPPRTHRQVTPGTPAAPPRTHRQVTPGTPAAPPRTHRQVTPGTPAEPPRTHRQVTPGTPAASPRTHRQATPGRPAEPPRTHRQATPGTPAEPGTATEAATPTDQQGCAAHVREVAQGEGGVRRQGLHPRRRDRAH